MASTYIGLKAIVDPGKQAVVRAVNEGANYMVAEGADHAPVKEGTLAASIHTYGAKVDGTGVEAKVMTGAEASEYAVPQHEGAGPHTIEPKNKQALFWPGAAHPVKKVEHPGNPATLFLSEPLVGFSPKFQKVVAKAARESY